MKRILFLALAALTIVSCVNSSNNLYNKKLIFVSILPLQQFAQKIAGDDYTVKVMVKPGESPATYQPTVKQLKQLAKAKVFFTADVAFEKAWLNRIKSINPKLIIVNTTKGIKKRKMVNHSHSHFDDDKHGNNNLDPHTWLNPKLMDIQCKNILKAFINLSKTDESKEQHIASYQKISKKLKKLNDKLVNLSISKKQRKFIVFHPAWGYLADAMHMQQIAIEDEGKEPTAKHMAKIAKIAKEDSIKIIIVQKQFSTKASQTIADMINGKVISLNPLAKNYFANFELIINAFDTALK